MTEPNREIVRELLVKERKSIQVFYHILKNNLWKTKNTQAFFAIDKGLLNFYKVNDDFLISILAYSFPVVNIPITYEKKRKAYKEEKAILNKMKKRMRLSEMEAVEVLAIIKELAKRSPPSFSTQLKNELRLEKKEIEFLGLPASISKTTSSPIHQVKQSGLDKWS